MTDAACFSVIVDGLLFIGVFLFYRLVAQAARAVIIASCAGDHGHGEEFSYRAMPWKRAKALGPPLLGMELFAQAFRIQREAIAAAGHFIPMVQENVRGANPWGEGDVRAVALELWELSPLGRCPGADADHARPAFDEIHPRRHSRR
jgi:hypothetical protein